MLYEVAPSDVCAGIVFMRVPANAAAAKSASAETFIATPLSRLEQGLKAGEMSCCSVLHLAQ
jgi:hypothetical protein